MNRTINDELVSRGFFGSTNNIQSIQSSPADIASPSPTVVSSPANTSDTSGEDPDDIAEYLGDPASDD